ncbi:MAG: WXG100 family type VII secretion target, partial [Anaerolineae bacterium]|nr:WXG100 family type VII secretion target [Anaerolineae bacterium]
KDLTGRKHLTMAHIAVNLENLQTIAVALRAHSGCLQDAIQSLEAEMARLATEQFSGQRAEALRLRFQAVRASLAQYATMLNKFADQLDEAAVAFRHADSAHHQASSSAFQLATVFSTGTQAARAQAAQAAVRAVTWNKLW